MVDTNEEVPFQPKPSLTIKLKKGWKFEDGELRTVAKQNGKSVDENADTKPEVPTEPLISTLPDDVAISLKTPTLANEKRKLLDSEIQLLRYLIVVFDNANDTQIIVDTLSRHPAIEEVTLPPEVIPAKP